MFKLFFVFIASGLLINGCSSANILSQLTDSQWEATSLLGQTLDVGSLEKGLPTLIFGRDGKLSGSTSCNNFIGSYKMDGTKLLLDPGAMTKMICPGTTEQDFLSAIGRVDNFNLNGSKLNLFNGSDLVMTFVPKK